MLTKFSGSNPNGPYLGWENEKETFCVVLTYSIKWAHEIRKFLCHSHATTAKKCTKKRDAHAKLFFCQSKPIVFLLFAIVIAKTPYCCHPEILQPWKRDITLLSSIVKQNSLLLPPPLRKKSWQAVEKKWSIWIFSKKCTLTYSTVHIQVQWNFWFYVFQLVLEFSLLTW